jgi:hypothetical protein
MESGGIAPRLLTSALDGGEWSTSRPERFTIWEIVPGIQLERRLGGPQSRSGRYRGGKKVKLSLQEAVEAHIFVRRRGFHIFYTIDSQMAVRFSALHAGHPLPTGFLLEAESTPGS